MMTDVIDAAHLAHQREWSAETFGPGMRTKGIIEHIRFELAEIWLDPTCLEEWVDVIILGFDGAWRAGHEPQAVIDAIKAKQRRNESREWPDWRQFGDEPIEHIKPPEATDIYGGRAGVILAGLLDGASHASCDSCRAVMLRARDLIEKLLSQRGKSEVLGPH